MMRMPGSVAGNSLVERNRPQISSFGRAEVRRSLLTRNTVRAQGPIPIGSRIGVEKQPRLFLRKCQQRCVDDQQKARMRCMGGCARFLGQNSPLFRSCISSCQRGEDFYRGLGVEAESNILRASPELLPGYCDSRCLSPMLTSMPRLFGP
jgi:hypothetical protein